MSTTVKRGLALFMTLVLFLVLLPVLPAAAEGNGNTGMLEIAIESHVGSPTATPSGRTTSSIGSSTVLLNHDGSIDAAGTTYGYKITASYISSVDSGENELLLWAKKGLTTTDYGDKNNLLNMSKSGGKSITLTVDGLSNLDYYKDETSWIYYIFASCNGVVETRTINVAVLQKAVNAIHYETRGMQIRSINGEAIQLGPYAYAAHLDSPVANDTGLGTWFSAGSGSYKSVHDGVSYPNCYLDVTFAGKDHHSGLTADSEAAITAWLQQVYEHLLETNNIGLLGDGETITLSGPAYVYGCGYGGKEIGYNMAYYRPGISKNAEGNATINTYVGWSTTTQQDLYAAKRWITITFPRPSNGDISVYAYDIAKADPTDPQAGLLGTTIVQSSARARRPQSVTDYVRSMIDLILSSWGSGTSEAVTKGWYFDGNGLANASSSNLQADATETIRLREEAVAQLKAQGDSYNAFGDVRISSIRTATPKLAEALDGYKFQFALGEDMLNAGAYGILTPLATDESQTVGMVASFDANAPVLRLYYSAPPSYTVKVRYNGVIDEGLTLEYRAELGAIIREADVDTSVVPEGCTIRDIENVPLTVVDDTTKNVIIIDCANDSRHYTIEYYLDGVYSESETMTAENGDVVTDPPIKGFPGYTLGKITGTPLRVVDNNGVIRVYYKKNVAPASADPMARLYKDEYRTQITVEKSGYGVYGLFFVDMSEYLSAYETPRWSVWGGCSASARSKTEPTYQKLGSHGTQIDWRDAVVTASWMEGLPVTEANKNGHKVTVQMVYDSEHSTSTVWAFRLPANSGSSKNYPCAYIPINTPDGKNAWKIDFKLTVNCNKYSWYTTPRSVPCNGHASIYGTWYHNYTIYDLHENWTPMTISKAATAYLSIKGSMYEADFTGERS